MIYKVTTEADGDGLTARTLGFFDARSEQQVLNYLIEKDIKPYYDFTIIELTVVDISNFIPSQKDDL